MKCVILSGGSGNDSLIKGLVGLYPQIDIKIIVNAYDDGKSTGVCRKITNCLGVSDIRKNHYRMYEVKTPNIDDGFLKFYNNRYDLEMDNKKEYVRFLLEEFGLTFLNPYSDRFFDSLPQNETLDFKSFNIANIVYAQMYKEKGYEYTNSFFCSLLGIEDFVLLNSFDNVVLKARAHGKRLSCEADIVEYCTSSNPIFSMDYESELPNLGKRLNDRAINAIREAELIILSSGTFWSSLYPTLDYGGLYKHINEAKAKKIWVMNNEEDKDALGVGSNYFIERLEVMGLDLKDFTILQNEDACKSLQQSNDNYDILRYHMGNERGKHSPMRLAQCILRKYYSLDAYYATIFVDFDDTLWSRDATKDPQLLSNSMENISLLSRLNEAQVVTGNSYESVKGRLGSIKNIVWADANSVAYRNGRVYNIIEDNLLKDEEVVKISTYLNMEVLCGEMKLSINNRFFPTFIKIKPIDGNVRKALCARINNFLDRHFGNVVAKCTGRTTIDILKVGNTKAQVFSKVAQSWNTLYIGDEIKEGNDCEIAKKCTHSIEVGDIYETNLILRLLIENEEHDLWDNC